MESSKNQSNRSWDEIVAAAREKRPPAIDIRAAVRAQIEQECVQLTRDRRHVPGMLESLMELFSGAAPKAAFAAICLFIAGAAIRSIADVEASELIELEQPEGKSRTTVFDAVNVDLESDWVAYL